MYKAVFLDRDGVINEDTSHQKNIKDIKLLEKVPEAIKYFKEHGFKVVVVTNQPIVARGLATEEEIESLHNQMNQHIGKKTGVRIDKFYFCPHHPEIHPDVPEHAKKYRRACDCRKPSPGMILKAVEEMHIDLKKSWMIGDQVTDIVAGKSAGCATIMVKSPKNNSTIISSISYNPETKPDYVVESLFHATKIIR